MVVKYLLSDDSFQESFAEYIRSHQWAIWRLIDILENAHSIDPSRPIDISIDKLENLVRIVGEYLRMSFAARGMVRKPEPLGSLLSSF